MSTPPDTTPHAGPASHAGKPHSAAVRYLFVFVLGLVLGVVAVVMLLRALEARKTWQDHYPKATMHLLSAHSAQLRDALQANRCAATDVLPHLQALRVLGNDLEPAFADLRDDTRFATHAGKFRGAIDSALASPPLNCAGLKTTTEAIGADCKACHRDFRG
ncbi:hypothetical protein [Luteimonas sp. MC1572]|uniref:hypothetical protein n=1 Tax=Luteimonas sp. MC1572 TaxID=2799325 RepID=UPI0018F0E6E4|nr:hypothetical protein [Luteimonas sp. MC1572]MBJ6982957.1 hypothetical protein [Luteimonas sp. MC1572]QQO04176.1 hypothetical protein JGR64_05345 [Luteimonas sp. MC1572]